MAVCKFIGYVIAFALSVVLSGCAVAPPPGNSPTASPRYPSAQSPRQNVAAGQAATQPKPAATQPKLEPPAVQRFYPKAPAQTVTLVPQIVNTLYMADISPDGKYLVGYNAKEFELWDLEVGMKITEALADVHPSYHVIAEAAEGFVLATYSHQQKHIELRRLADLELIGTIQAANPSYLLPDSIDRSKFLFGYTAPGYKHAAAVFDVNLMKIVEFAPLVGTFESRVSPQQLQQAILVSFKDQQSKDLRSGIGLFKAKKFKQQNPSAQTASIECKLPEHMEGVNVLEVFDDKPWVVVSYYHIISAKPLKLDYFVEIYDVAENKTIKNFSLGEYTCLNACLVPEVKRLYFSHKGITCFDFEKNQELPKLQVAPDSFGAKIIRRNALNHVEVVVTDKQGIYILDGATTLIKRRIGFPNFSEIAVLDEDSFAVGARIYKIPSLDLDSELELIPIERTPSQNGEKKYIRGKLEENGILISDLKPYGDGYTGITKLWVAERDTGKLIKELDTSVITNLQRTSLPVTAPNGKWIAVTCGNSGLQSSRLVILDHELNVKYTYKSDAIADADALVPIGFVRTLFTGGDRYIAAQDGVNNIRIFDLLENGRELTAFPAPQKVTKILDSTITVNHSLIYIAQNEPIAYFAQNQKIAKGLAFGMQTYNLLTRSKIKDIYFSTDPDSLLFGPVSFGYQHNGTLYACTSNGQLIAYNLAQDRILWSRHYDGYGVRDNLRDGKILLQTGAQLNLLDAENGELICEVYSLPEEHGLLAVSPEGYYLGSPGAEEFLGVRVGNQIQSLGQYQQVLRKPEIVRQRLAAAMEGGAGQVAVADWTQSLNGRLLPPEIQLLQPIGDSQQRAEIRVSIQAIPQSRPIAAYRLTHNGRQIQQPFSTPIEESKKIDIPLQLLPGENKLELELVDQIGIKSRPLHLAAFYHAPPELRPHVYILTIGIDNYADQSLNLRFCSNDAKAIAENIGAGGKDIFGEIHTERLVDQQATRVEIIKMIDSFFQRARPQDVTVLFFAGHSVKSETQEFYLAPHDIELNSIAATGIHWSEIQRLFEKKISAKKGIIILDSCYSGQWGVRSLDIKPHHVMADELSIGAGLIVLASSTGIERSKEEIEWGHGALTYTILRAIAGNGDLDRNGKLSVLELARFVSNEVPKLTAGRQHPAIPYLKQFVDYPIAATVQK